jgi:hypothetical protein
MNDHYSLIGVLLGILGIMIRLSTTAILGQPAPKLTEGLIVFIACTALSAGAKVCVLSINGKISGISDNDRIYFFLGGLAVIWISGEALWSMLAVD